MVVKPQAVGGRKGLLPFEGDEEIVSTLDESQGSS